MIDDPLVLVDEPEDGAVDAYAWVKVTEKIDTPEKALEVIDRDYPLDENLLCYRVKAKPQQHMRPSSGGAPSQTHEEMWIPADPMDTRAWLFWCIEVVDTEEAGA
jgi:hypothetical protein